MRILFLTCLFLIINLLHGQSFQGYQLEETQNRLKRQNNIYQFLQHVLASSSNGFAQSNNRQDFPQEFAPFSNPFYQNSKRENVVVNVNQPDSKPTTIINNLNPEYFSSCPCERYVRGQNGELGCLCPKRQIFRKCSGSTVCVLKNFCDNGLLFDTQHIPQGNNVELCDESTHTCCLPPVEVRKQSTYSDTHQNYNHFAKSTADSDKKYIINGNIYVNHGSPTTQFKTENEKKFQYTVMQPEQLPSQVQTNPQEVSLSAQPQQENHEMSPQIMDNPVPILADRNSNPSTERPASVQTIPPSLVRPTRPPVALTTEPVFESKIKAEPQSTTIFESLFTSEITTYRPKLPTSPSVNTPETTTDTLSDLLKPNEIESIFGSPNQMNNKSDDVPTFPGLSTMSEEIAGLSFQNEGSTETSVGVSLIENVPSLMQMDFPQSNLLAPMKKPEIFLSGKIEKLRNNTKTNSTTVNRIGTRIFVETPKPTKVFPTDSPAINQVQEAYFNYPEPPMLTTFLPPNNIPNRFTTPANTIVSTCPSNMKCVQDRYCTPEGFVSTVPVIITKEEEIRKNLLLKCGDGSSGQIGKCCFDKNA